MLIILIFWPSQEYIGTWYMVVCIRMPIQDLTYSLDEVASYVIHRKLLDLDFLFPSSFEEMLKIELLLSNMIHKGSYHVAKMWIL